MNFLEFSIFHFSDAYNLATLGVTEGDWIILGNNTLENFQIDLAKMVFHRIKDHKTLQLISAIEVRYILEFAFAFYYKILTIKYY